MPVLAQRHRRTIHEKLSPIVGDEETEAMLAHFPASPGEEPVTERSLDSRLSQLEARLTGVIYRNVFAGLLGGLTIGMGVAAGVAAAINAIGGPPGG